MRSNLEPDIWGSHVWFFLDSLCISYSNTPTEKEKIYYKNFFIAVGEILPCHHCREHYKEYIKSYPLDEEILKSKKNLINWVLKLHNKINKIKQKKIISLSEFNNYYDNIYKNKCKIKCNFPSTNEINNNPDIVFFKILLFSAIIVIIFTFIIKIINKK